MYLDVVGEQISCAWQVTGYLMALRSARRRDAHASRSRAHARGRTLQYARRPSAAQMFRRGSCPPFDVAVLASTSDASVTLPGSLKLWRWVMGDGPKPARSPNPDRDIISCQYALVLFVRAVAIFARQARTTREEAEEGRGPSAQTAATPASPLAVHLH